MKKNPSIYIFILLLVFIYACEESVNTNADFRERYVLTSIIDCDSERQLAYVTRTYDPEIEEINPDVETVFLQDADIKIWYEYDVYEFEDTTLMSIDGKVASCYIVNDLKPKSNEIIEIEALLPNNLLLRSSTKVPSVSKIKMESSNGRQISQNTINELTVAWTNIGKFIYDPKFVINYYNNGDTNHTIIEKVVPLDFEINNSDTIYVYPKPSNRTNLGISKKALTNALNEISGNDQLKSNYVILNLELQMKVYDENLSAYYSSSHQFLDQFSITLDSQLYSNIEGGHGIFAAYIIKKLSIRLDNNYIRSFGYRYGQ